MTRAVLSKIQGIVKRDKNFEIVRWCDEWQKKGLAPKGDYLEFGSYQGVSAIAFYRQLHRFYKGKIPKDSFHMYLFDSFIGLPEAQHEADRHPKWKKGVFDVGGKEKFRQILLNAGLPSDRFTLVEGFYDESLAKFDWGKIKFASYVNMDCDYYSSTVTALEGVKKVLGNRSLIYFDDLHSFAGNPGKGQVRALSEFNKANPDMGINPCPMLAKHAEQRIYWAWKN